MESVIPLALTVAPEVALWLVGSDAETANVAVQRAVEDATGTSQVDAAMTVLQQDPAIAAKLRLKLIEIAAGCQRASRTADLEGLEAKLRGTIDACLHSIPPSSPKTANGWSAPIVSAVVLVTFGVIVTIILLHGMPAGSETAVNMLLGTLAAMATSVVSYWVGSSAGSARKDDRLAQAGK